MEPTEEREPQQATKARTCPWYGLGRASHQKWQGGYCGCGYCGGHIFGKSTGATVQ